MIYLSEPLKERFYKPPKLDIMNFKNMLVILEKEYLQRVKKRTFLLTTLLTPLIFSAIMALPVLIRTLTENNKSNDKYEVAVIDKSNIIANKLNDNNNIAFSLADFNPDSLLSLNNKYSAVLTIGENIVEDPSNVSLKMKKEIVMKDETYIRKSLENIISDQRSQKYNIENLDSIISDLKVNVNMNTIILDKDGVEKASSTGLNYALGFGGGFLIYMFIFMYGGMILNSVIDEKSTKVVEVMVSTISPMQMMMGKILGVGLVAITQFLIWGIMFLVTSNIAMSLIGGGDISQAAQAMQQSDISPALATTLASMSDVFFILKVLLTFSAYFFGGFLFYAACYSAIGSAVDNIQDIQQLQMPIILPLIAAIIVLPMTIEDPHGPVGFWMSMFPMTSPIVMLARIPSGVPLWELLLSLSLLYASFMGMIWVAGRVYRVGIFMHGKKPSLMDLYRWIKYK